MEKFEKVKEISVFFPTYKFPVNITIVHEKGTDEKEAMVFQAENVEVEWLSSGMTDYWLVFRKPATCEFDAEEKRLFCKTEVAV
jgi:hypothetical protein